MRATTRMEQAGTAVLFEMWKYKSFTLCTGLLAVVAV